MKKKTRRFDDGGLTSPDAKDIRARALMFAKLADEGTSDESEAQKAFSRVVREANEAEAEASDRRARASSTPAARTAPAPASSSPSRSSDVDMGSQNDAAPEVRSRVDMGSQNDAAPTVRTPPSASSAAAVGRAGQARASSTPSSVLREIRGGDNADINQARIEARRQAEAAARQRREEADAASQAGSQRGASIAEGRRNQEAAEAASARAAAAKSPGLGRSMNRSQPAKPSSTESPRAPTRRFMADRMRRGVNRPSGTDSFAKGGSVGSASKRGDGIAKRGKTRGRLV